MKHETNTSKDTVNHWESVISLTKNDITNHMSLLFMAVTSLHTYVYNTYMCRLHRTIDLTCQICL